MSSSATIEAYHSTIDISADQAGHEAWNHARPIPITRYWSGDEAPASRHAEARILWSDNALCVRFVGQQQEPLIVSGAPQLGKKSLGLWDRDVCEVFIAPDPAEPNRYFEFEAAPTGEWIDLAINLTPAERLTDWEFRSGMTAAAHVAEDQIIITLRIPWGDRIHKPSPGEKWRANLCRCIGSGSGRGYLAWQPTHTEEPNFHVPDVFGWLVFTNEGNEPG